MCFKLDSGADANVLPLGTYERLRSVAPLIQFQFNSIQNSLFSTQHIVHTTMFLAYVLKRERAEDSAYVGSFPNIII